MINFVSGCIEVYRKTIREYLLWLQESSTENKQEHQQWQHKLENTRNIFGVTVEEEEQMIETERIFLEVN